MTEKASAGDPLAISAQEWNRHVDAANDFDQRRFSTDTGAGVADGSQTKFWVKNTSGLAVPRFGVLSLGEPLFGPDVNVDEFKNNYCFNGITPVAGNVLLALEPLADGALGKCLGSGVTVAQINVTDATHLAADADPGITANLKSAASGPLKILWKESGTGVKWSLVRLGAGDSLTPTWKNNSGESTPAYSVIRANSTTAARVEGYKPSTTFWRNHVVNTGAIVLNGNNGSWQTGPFVLVAYDTGTPAAGEMWGPKPSQWTISKNFPGFTIVGVYDASAKIAAAVQEPITKLIGKLSASIPKGTGGGSNNVTIWTGQSGDEADGGWTAIPAFNQTQYDLTYSSSDKMWVELLYIDGWWYVVSSQMLAMWVKFTLPSALALTDASKSACTIDSYWQGRSPGSSLTIYNPTASTNYIFKGASGAKGLACYDDINNKYWIVQLEC